MLGFSFTDIAIRQSTGSNPLADSYFVLDPSNTATLFQDSAATIPVVADGDPVGAALDGQGGAASAVQADNGKRPIYRSVGGISWLEFDGVDDFLTVSPKPSSGLFSDAGRAFTIAAGYELSDGTVLARGASTQSERELHLFWQTDPRIVVRGGAQTRFGFSSPSNQVNAISWDGSALTVLDNQDQPVAVPVGTSAENAAQEVVIGARTNGTGFFGVGRIYGVVIKDVASSDGELRALNAYLRAKQ